MLEKMKEAQRQAAREARAAAEAEDDEDAETKEIMDAEVVAVEEGSDEE